jgi:hypothetical protein
MIRYLTVGILRIIRDILFHLLNSLNRRNQQKNSKNLSLFQGRSDPDEFVLENVESLRTNGIVILDEHFKANPYFTEVVKKFKNLMSGGVYRSDRVNLFDHEFKYRVNNIWNEIPEISALVFDQTICEIVSRYKKLIPGFQVSSYKTIPYKEVPLGSGNFHQDQFGDISIFILLEDVGPLNGGSQFVCGSHSQSLSFGSIKFIRSVLSSLIKLRLPSVPTRNLFYDEKDVEIYYPKTNWKRAFALKGSVILMDVSGIHRGPHWDDSVSHQNKLSRSVLHIACREEVIFGSGTLKKAPFERGDQYLEDHNFWGKLVRQQTAKMAK